MSQPHGWMPAVDAEAVHALLCESDAYQAAKTGTRAPARRPETTRRLVEAGAVRVLSGDAGPIAMFTLTETAAFDVAAAGYEPSPRPLYLQRLAVGAEAAAAGSLVGVQALRRAIEEAQALGASVLRCEANPDLVGTRQLLERLGFQQRGPVHADDTRRWVYLELPLDPPVTATV
ncbi:hypothetical protein V6U77_09190 [Micromonospora sp. CPCC 205546]|uniref:hypothetical protein n=1 Tax=Micromonospora sp. CPCC 205546 TaxID=3122397 RepID=UPI002FF0045E